MLDFLVDVVFDDEDVEVVLWCARRGVIDVAGEEGVEDASVVLDESALGRASWKRESRLGMFCMYVL